MKQFSACVILRFSALAMYKIRPFLAHAEAGKAKGESVAHLE